MTAMIFSSLESEKAFMVMRNTSYSYSIFNLGGFILSYVLVKMNSKAINKAKKEKKEREEATDTALIKNSNSSINKKINGNRN